MAESLHVLVFDGMADWEAYAVLDRLRHAPGMAAIPVGFDSFPVTAASGMQHAPRLTLAELPRAASQALLLPGGGAWSASEYPVELLGRVLRELAEADVAIAASGSAAIALARAGLLANRFHTGDLDELPRYPGCLQRRPVPSMHDRGVFTARADAAGDLASLLRPRLHGMPRAAARQGATSAAASG